MKGKTYWFLLFVMLFPRPSFAAGQSSFSYRIPVDVVGTAGGKAYSTNYKLSYTLGQSSPVGISSGSLYTLYWGFWYAIIGIGSSANQLPVIDSFTASLMSGLAPLEVTFLCQAHDPDGQIMQYKINYGDGSEDTNGNGNFTHTYIKPGSYEPTCYARDNNGAEAVRGIIVSVNETAHHCDASNISLCGSKEECENIGGHWCHGACYAGECAPVGKKVGLWSVPSTAPVQADNGRVSCLFSYADPVDILVGFLSCDFRTIYWLKFASCIFANSFTNALVSRVTEAKCNSIFLPEPNGYVFWLVSSVPIADLDFERGPYYLYFYVVGNCI